MSRPRRDGSTRLRHGQVRRESRGVGRHRQHSSRSRAPRRVRGISRRPTWLADSLPGLLGPSRRAAWRRYCLRRTVSTMLILSGGGLLFLAGLSRSVTS